LIEIDSLFSTSSSQFVCSLCGRAWSAGADGKWPIRVTATDPPRAVAHCLTCAEMGAGYDARWCPAHMRAKPLAVQQLAETPATVRSSVRPTRADELRRILNRRRNGHLPEPQVELSD
jgi:hypothetical protein